MLLIFLNNDQGLVWFKRLNVLSRLGKYTKKQPIWVVFDQTVRRAGISLLTGAVYLLDIFSSSTQIYLKSFSTPADTTAGNKNNPFGLFLTKLCAGQDSNLRRTSPVDLQSTAIDHSATDAFHSYYP